MSSEQTRAYLSFALVALMFVLVIALFVEMPRENSTQINTALGFIAGAMSMACGYYFGSSELEKKKKTEETKQL